MIYYLYMNIIIFILAFIGLAISYKILYNKKHEIHVCPIGSNCKTVLQSSHNRFLGIPNEINGIIYYGIILVLYGITIPSLVPIPSLKTFLLVLSGGAFIFSIYLTFIQGVQLKKWCTWCIGSAIVSTGIFICTIMYTVPYFGEMLEFLSSQRYLMSIVYSLGFSLGLGSIATSYFLLYRFLKDFKITKKEKEVFQYTTQIVWLGIMMLLVSGIGLFIIGPFTPLYIFHTILLGVLVITETIITLFIIPHLSKISSKRKSIIDKLYSWRKLTFSVSAASISTWILLFVINHFYITNMSIPEYLFLYTGILILSIMASQILESKMFDEREKVNK